MRMIFSVRIVAASKSGCGGDLDGSTIHGELELVNMQFLGLDQACFSLQPVFRFSLFFT
jgi:hypothetical protein